MPDSSPWRVLAEASEHALLQRADVLLCQLRKAPTPVVLQAIEGALAQHPTPMVVVIHAAPSVGLPDTQTRLTASRIMKMSAPKIAAWVVVLEGSGFLRSALRSVANTVRLIARTRFLLAVVTNAQEAQAWIAEHTSAEVTAADITAPHLGGRAAS